jgi:DNA-binding transcriptional MerR regulator
VPKYLTTEELAERFRTSPSTCRYWRMQRYGPQGVRVGRRTLYDLAEVERWEAEQLAQAKATA